ncbi:MAG: hypothetical protein IT168_28765 [Bryobacterales bacterium]|nr:hypothetical protein [Bryobacterales bacterium]
MQTLMLFLVVTSGGFLVAGDKPDYSGTWRTEGSSASDAAIQIRLKDKEIRLRDAGATEEIVCNTVGKECQIKLDGKPAKVSYYYNGPMLVEWRLEGKDGKHVTKIRRKLSEDRRKMTVEIMPIEPQGSTREVTYIRIDDDRAASQSETAKR